MIIWFEREYNLTILQNMQDDPERKKNIIVCIIKKIWKFIQFSRVNVNYTGYVGVEKCSKVNRDVFGNLL